MFDLFANLLSSLASFLFPIFASYKALKTSDPAQLTPWLMYWVVFNCCLLAESWLSFILTWIPLYGYIRLLFFLYLILPQTQGARTIYEEHLHPLLEDNEGAIDDLIASTHHRLKAAGLTYLRRAIELLKTRILGLPPSDETPTSTSSASTASSAAAGDGAGGQADGSPRSYTQSLLARFAVPTARWAGATTAPAGDFYALLASAVSAATGAAGGRASPDARPLIPLDVGGPADRLDFIAAQRQRLNILLAALDCEDQDLRRATTTATPPGTFSSDGAETEASSSSPAVTRRPSSGLSKSRSEADFEKVEAESGAEDDGSVLRRRHAPASGGGPWMPWAWASGPGGLGASLRESEPQ